MRVAPKGLIIKTLLTQTIGLQVIIVQVHVQLIRMYFVVTSICCY